MMRFKKGLLFLFALAAALLEMNRVARADTVVVGTPVQNGYDVKLYNQTDTAVVKQSLGLGAGDFQNSLLNGQSVHMYCVDIPDRANPSNTITLSAEVNTHGVIYNDNTYYGHAWKDTVDAVPNAGGIDYLMRQYGTSSNVDIQVSLQTAIWKLIYGSHLVTDLNLHGGYAGGIPPYFNSFVAQGLAHANDALTNDVYWINPYSKKGLNQSDYSQGMIAYLPSKQGPSNVPVPGTLVMSSILFGMFGAVRSRKLRTSKFVS